MYTNNTVDVSELTPRSPIVCFLPDGVDETIHRQ